MTLLLRKNALLTWIALGLIIVGSSFCFTHAKTRPSPNKPVNFHVETQLNTQTTPVGTRFEIVTVEPVTFDDGILPADTLLSGHIIKIRSSRRLGFAAYFTVQFDAYAPPGHEPIALPPGPNTQLSFMQDKNATAVHVVAKSIILQHSSLMVSVPIGIVLGLSAPAVVAVDTTADIIIGGTYGYRHKVAGDTRPTYKRVAGGVFRSMSSIPIASDLIHKSPNIVYAPGDEKAFPLTPALLKTIMASLPEQYPPLDTHLTHPDQAYFLFIPPPSLTPHTLTSNFMLNSKNLGLTQPIKTDHWLENYDYPSQNHIDY